MQSTWNMVAGGRWTRWLPVCAALLVSACSESDSDWRGDPYGGSFWLDGCCGGFCVDVSPPPSLHFELTGESRLFAVDFQLPAQHELFSTRLEPAVEGFEVASSVVQSSSGCGPRLLHVEFRLPASAPLGCPKSVDLNWTAAAGGWRPEPWIVPVTCTQAAAALETYRPTIAPEAIDWSGLQPGETGTALLMVEAPAELTVTLGPLSLTSGTAEQDFDLTNCALDGKVLQPGEATSCNVKWTRPSAAPLVTRLYLAWMGERYSWIPVVAE